jgi:hypothetical protein
MIPLRQYLTVELFHVLIECPGMHKIWVRWNANNELRDAGEFWRCADAHFEQCDACKVAAVAHKLST